MDHCTPSLRVTGQRILHLADDQPTELEPAFTFHGFRYAEVQSDAEILTAEFIAIFSDTTDVGTLSALTRTSTVFTRMSSGHSGTISCRCPGLPPAG